MTESSKASTNTISEQKSQDHLEEAQRVQGTQSQNDTSDSQVQELEKLQKRIQELEAEVKEKESKHLYLYADFENFKKRSIKERSDLLKFGWESLARELLQTIDNLERALSHVPANTDANLVEGLNLVLDQFRSTLQKYGIQRIESIKKDFDPNFHEAVGQEASDEPSGTIVKEHLGGYTLHGRLLRPARVIISDGQLPTKSG